MPNNDTDKVQQEIKMLEDYIDGKRNAHNVIDEVIKEENELDIGDFLSYLTSFATKCQQSEVQSRVVILLAEFQKSEKIVKFNNNKIFRDLQVELVDWFDSMFTFVYH